MPVRLTETERRVAEMYSRGLRPREIAEKLGISINTVYKALSKARRYMEVVEAPSAGTSHYYAFNASVYTYPTGPVASPMSVVVDKAVVVQDLYGAVLRKLDEILSLLKEERRNGDAKEGAPGAAQQIDAGAPPKEDHDGHMPEALKKNVWISLLRSKVT
jgi:hypothetical protein